MEICTAVYWWKELWTWRNITWWKADLVDSHTSSLHSCFNGCNILSGWPNSECVRGGHGMSVKVSVGRVHISLDWRCTIKEYRTDRIDDNKDDSTHLSKGPASLCCNLSWKRRRWMQRQEAKSSEAHSKPTTYCLFRVGIERKLSATAQVLNIPQWLRGWVKFYPRCVR